MSATTEQEKVRFVSRARQLQVILIPPREEHHSDGTKTPVPGLIAQFEPDPLTGGLRGAYETADPDEIERLRRHPQRDEYFEEAEVPVAPLPDPSDELAEAAVLSARGDVDGLADLYEREQKGHSRPLVLETAREALLALEGASASSEGSSGGSDPGD